MIVTKLNGIDLDYFLRIVQNAKNEGQTLYLSQPVMDPSVPGIDRSVAGLKVKRGGSAWCPPFAWTEQH